MSEWADYGARNKAANDAYRRRGCPDCGDIVLDAFGHEGVRCRLCKLRAKESA